MIEFKNINKTYNSYDNLFHAVHDFSLTIEDHEIFGIIGQSGAGKSTLLRFINALETPDSGQLIVHGQDLNALSTKALRQHKYTTSMVFQQFNLLNNLTVEQNIQLPLKLTSREHCLSVNEVLDIVGLLDKKKQFPSQLSGGQKQRVGIARALITKPDIMLLDEPTSALDEQTTRELTVVLRHIHQHFKMTMVVVSHELGFIQSLCDRVAIIDNGHLEDIIHLRQRDNRHLIQSSSYVAYVREVLSHG